MVYGKLLTQTDISFMVKKYQWVSGTIYDRYDNNDPNLYSKQFFVINDNNEVYKCIHNGYSPNFTNGIASTVKPSITDTFSSFKTSDGYIWKYMFTCERSAYNKFSTSSYIPVTANSEVKDNAVPGSIDNIILMDGGSGYDIFEEGFLKSFVNNYVVTLPDTSSPLDNYYNDSSIYLKSGFGAGQSRPIISYRGDSKQLSVNPPFSYYQNINLDHTKIYGGDFFAAGDYVNQLVSKLVYVFKSGSLNVGDIIYQSDTNAYGEILHANSIAYIVQNESDVNNLFDLRYPIYSTKDAPVIKPGKVSVNTSNYSRIDNVYSNVVANTIGVNATSDTIKINKANTIFNVGDVVYYTVPTNNTAIAGLTGNRNYYISFSNASDIALSSVSPLFGGVNVNITESRTTSTGEQHIFTGNVNFNSIYSINDYIRLGDISTKNIRRITAVTSTYVNVDYDLPVSLNNVNNYIIPTAADIESVLSHHTVGTIVYNNLKSLEIVYEDVTPLGSEYADGESVSVVDVNNLSQFSNGTISFSNSTFMIVSNIQNIAGFIPDFYLLGGSTNTKSRIKSISSYPNLTVEVDYGGYYIENDPAPHQYLHGTKIFITKQDGTPVGNAHIVSTYTSPGDLTEYIISPSVNITGDGNGAVAYCTVDLSDKNPSRSISTIQFINQGSNYTKANVSITAGRGTGSVNLNNSAVVKAQISPVNGHGFDPYSELGAVYCGINKTFNSAAQESFLIPSYGSYRNVGIIKNPLYSDVIFNTSNFDRGNLILRTGTYTGIFNIGEIVIQPYTNAAGIVVYANSTYVELKNKKGSFIYNTNHDNVYGLSSNYTANVYMANTKYFELPAALESISNIDKGGTGKLNQQITPVNGTQQIRMTEVVGKFTAGDNLYEPATNTYSTVDSIYISNGYVNVSTNFGYKINQTARITLSSNTKVYSLYEYVTQDKSYATGRIISTCDELDIIYNGTVAWSVGEMIKSTTTQGSAVISYHDATKKYLKLTNVSKLSPFNETDNRPFLSGHTITNLSGSKSTTINIVYPVIILDDVNYISGSQTTPYLGVFTVTSENAIRGNTTGAIGYATLENSIRLPDLIRESGQVIYTKNLQKFDRSLTSTEQVKLIIKF
jgi:hypothetical protein